MVVVVLAGCYAPDAPDCTLACTADTDCISGQTCTTDHLCAANLTTCGSQAITDGGVPVTDAGPVVMLTVHVDKDGSVRDSNNDVCASPANEQIDCTFPVHAGDPLTITAVPNLTKQFDGWMGPPCMGQLAACQTTPAGNLMVSAKFK
ncbi:MAG: hypothetical protein ABI591_15795 [Kofleriaceae bacterium]